MSHTDPQPTISQDDSIKNLRNVMKLHGASSGSGWEQAWQGNHTPWERAIGSKPQPALVSTIEKDERTKGLIPKEGGKAVVPGCGRGQDVEYLAQRGFTCTGVDISQTAVERAKEWLKSRPKDESHSRVHFLQTDYFALTDDTHRGHHSLIKAADLIYDYTFFCAIPKELHSKWAASHAVSLKPGGKLLMLVFPLRPEGNDSQDGPPYFVQVDEITSLLSNDFELEHLGDPLEHAPDKAGKEKIMIWRRK